MLEGQVHLEQLRPHVGAACLDPEDVVAVLVREIKEFVSLLKGVVVGKDDTRLFSVETKDSYPVDDALLFFWAVRNS